MKKTTSPAYRPRIDAHGVAFHDMNCPLFKDGECLVQGIFPYGICYAWARDIISKFRKDPFSHDCEFCNNNNIDDKSGHC